MRKVVADEQNFNGPGEADGTRMWSILHLVG